MTLIAVNGVELAVERAGDGDPLVLVHGSWGDRTGWVFVEEELAKTFHVVSYDRRGHSSSPEATGTRRDDEDDLEALIEHLDTGPVHLVGNSFGASISLGLTARRPDLVRTLCVHEPPLTDLAADDPVVADALAQVGRVFPLIETGDTEEALKVFVNDVALGPGAFDLLPPEDRARMAGNAGTFLGELQDPGFSAVDLEALAASATPMLLTYGDQSPPFFEKIVDQLRSGLPNLRVEVMEGAGHLPHITNATQWVAKVREHTSRG
jgi:pimeloyl-ACP methyl ester carboxylesterase